MPQSILILGSGIAGPVLASFLLLTPAPAKEKPSITILERSSGPRSQGQNVDIRGTGLSVIRKLGLESVVRSSTTGESGVEFLDDNGTVWARFGADKSGEVQTGTSDIEILRGRLADIFLRRSQNISDKVRAEGGAGISYLYGDYAQSIEQDGEKVHVRFAKSGSTRSFDLVVGADGLQSLTRRIVWGENVNKACVKKLGWYGGFFSMPSDPTDSLWRKWYHTSSRRSIMLRPSGFKDKSTIFMIMHGDQNPKLDEIASNGDKGVQEQKAVIHEHFYGAQWQLPRILREMDVANDFYYDTIAQVHMPKWSKGRVVLLGDAAHCASPISGMGTTLALNGAYSLAGALSQHPNNLEIAMNRYEDKMRPFVNRAQKLPLGGKLFELINPETRWGLSIMFAIMWLIDWTGVVNLLFRFAGPPAAAIEVEDFGFLNMEEAEVESTE